VGGSFPSTAIGGEKGGKVNTGKVTQHEGGQGTSTDNRLEGVGGWRLFGTGEIREGGGGSRVWGCTKGKAHEKL